ncbi:MAG: DUF2752 domain-containing protein [Planctomycetota bacterium]|jgi:hypothetical protein|nr:DUF2752 domain-containing protein [Planctomycetota bacterium]
MKRWALFLGSTLFLGVAWFCRPYLATIPDLCLFKRMVGVGCPGCGLTRSVAATAHLQLGEAFQFHLFGPFILTAAILFWGSLLLGFRIPWNGKQGTYVMGAVLVVLLLYYGIRLSLGIVP